MKKVVKLTESDLENIVRRVIEEQTMGVAFGGIGNGLMMKGETTEQDTRSSKDDLIEKWNERFPDPVWISKARNMPIGLENYETLKDQDFVKMYSVYKDFIDSKVPDVSQNNGEKFFKWMEDTMKLGKFHNIRTKFIDDIKNISQLQKGLPPVLKMSNYPNTNEYSRALGMAQRIDPTLKTNKFFGSVTPTGKKAYETMTMS